MIRVEELKARVMHLGPFASDDEYRQKHIDRLARELEKELHGRPEAQVQMAKRVL